MILKPSAGLSPSLSLVINGVPVPYRYVQHVEHTMDDSGHHDMIVVSMTGLPPRAVRDYRNAPIAFSVRVGSGFVEEFAGYVAYVHVLHSAANGTVNSSPLQDAKLICVGSSYAMRGEKHKSWDGYPLHSVIDEFSSVYGFSYDTPFDKLLYSPMIQDSESDWQFVVRYANLLGYCVTFHGTHMHVFDPFKSFSRGLSFHRLVTMKYPSKLLAPAPGQIVEFNAHMGEQHPDGVYKDTSISVHQDDGYVYDVNLSEVLGLGERGKYQDRLLDSVDTYDQAVRAIQSHRKDINDFNACVTCLGIPGCRPGGIVLIDGYGSEDTDGYWYVKSVKHSIHTKSFTTELELGRNKTSHLVPTAVSSFTPPPPPRLVNGRWISSKRSANAYT